MITIKVLHKKLSKLIEEGHGRKPVAINKRTFQSNLEEDGCVILEVEELLIEWVTMLDGDGWAKLNLDGSESGKIMLVLKGGTDE